MELTADTGARDTVVPKLMWAGIPIAPAVQSLRGMQYEVATGESIPMLGEKRCEMWAEGGLRPKDYQHASGRRPQSTSPPEPMR